MKKVFARTSGVILTIALLCSTISTMAVNTNPVKDVVVATTVKEVAKTSKMATVAAAAAKLWLNTQTFVSTVAKKGITLVNNHRIAAISGVAATGIAIFAGYKCFKYFKARQQARQVTRRNNEQTAKDDAVVNEGLINNYLIKHPEIKDRKVALANILADQEKALQEVKAANKATRTKAKSVAPKADNQ